MTENNLLLQISLSQIYIHILDEELEASLEEEFFNYSIKKD